MSHDSVFTFTGILELPFLIATVVFAFLVAKKLKGGVFGQGMTLIAWGALVMAAGHIHMQIEMFAGFNLFKMIAGDMGGAILWSIALLITWALTFFGFYGIYKAAGSR